MINIILISIQSISHIRILNGYVMDMEISWILMDIIMHIDGIFLILMDMDMHG